MRGRRDYLRTERFRLTVSDLAWVLRNMQDIAITEAQQSFSRTVSDLA